MPGRLSGSAVLGMTSADGSDAAGGGGASGFAAASNVFLLLELGRSLRTSPVSHSPSSFVWTLHGTSSGYCFPVGWKKVSNLYVLINFDYSE